MEESSSSSGQDLPAESITLTNYLRSPHETGFVVKHKCPAPGDYGEKQWDVVSWVASQHFSETVGKRQISEHIRTWDLPPCWFYSLDFLGSLDEPDRTFYHYQARFSTPTPRAPIRSTASVFFIVDVSRSKDPGRRPVDTHFVVESNRLVHTPGRGQFREKWLSDVIESKRALRRRYLP